MSKISMLLERKKPTVARQKAILDQLTIIHNVLSVSPTLETAEKTPAKTPAKTPSERPQTSFTFEEQGKVLRRE